MGDKSYEDYFPDPTLRPKLKGKSTNKEEEPDIQDFRKKMTSDPIAQYLMTQIKKKGGSGYTEKNLFYFVTCRLRKGMAEELIDTEDFMRGFLIIDLELNADTPDFRLWFPEPTTPNTEERRKKEMTAFRILNSGFFNPKSAAWRVYQFFVAEEAGKTYVELSFCITSS